MRIESIDYIIGEMVITWYPESDNPQVINHVIPDALKEDPDMSKEDLKALLELERPPEIVPLYNDYSEVPQSLKDLYAESDNMTELEKRLLELDRLTIEKYNAGITVNGVHVQSDKESLGMMAMYNTEMIVNGMPPIEWELADGTFHNYIVHDFKEMFKVVAKYMRSIYAHKKALKDQLEAAPDPTTVDLTIGWPEPTGSFTPYPS